MKLNKIKRQVKTKKRAIIEYDGSGTQWVGSSGTRYAVEPGIVITEENCLALMGIDKEKRAEYIVNQENTYAGVISEYRDEDEIELHWKMEVSYGCDYIVLLQDMAGNVYGVMKSLLDPIEASMGMGFTLRQGRIAVYDDIMCGAIIEPVVDAVMSDIMRTMKDLTGVA